MKFNKHKPLNIARYFFIASWLIQIPTSFAASFDCGKAHRTIEKLICGDGTVSELDQKMQPIYQTAYQSVADPENLKLEQRHWLKERDACKDTACLAQAYRTRLEQLTAGLKATKSCFRLLERKWPEVASGHYPVCVAYLKNLNRFCNEATPTCEYNLDPEIQALSKPDWEAIDPKANLELIAERVKLHNTYQPPSEQYWQVIKPEILRRIDQGMLRLWQTRIRLASNEEPVRVIRADLGCEPIIVVGPDRAQYLTPSTFVVVVDGDTDQISRRYDYLLDGIRDIVLHDSQTYLLQRYPGDDLVIEEPFSVPETGGKGMNSVCVFKPQK